MRMDEMPDFGSYTKKELKFVAYITPNKKTILRTMGSDEWEYYPIPLTLCKSKMENALKDRWGSLHEASKQEKHPICNTGCSICTGNRKETYCWSIENGGWITPETERKYDEKITTKCGHTFCKYCWDSTGWFVNHWEVIDKRVFPHIPGHYNHDATSRGKNFIQVFIHARRCPVCNDTIYKDEWYDEIRRRAR
jgi:hypothetical protein